jgi:hypothetical protein
MKVPLALRLLVLLALAWKLIVMAKNKNPLELEKAINLAAYEKSATIIIPQENRSLEGIKVFYRNTIRQKETENEGYMLISIFINLEKELKKAGIFRFFWHKPALVMAFYQSLEIVNYSEAKLAYAEILMKVNKKAFEAFENNSFFPKTEDFVVEGNTEKGVFDAFDLQFDLMKYLAKIIKYVGQD